MFEKDLLNGKTIVVTGGGSGLGKSMARRFGELGANIVISGRRKEVLEETAHEFSEQNIDVLTCPGDVRKMDDVETMSKQTLDKFGTVDALLNNAAGNFISPTKDVTPRGFEAISNIVFRGSFYLTHACGTRWIDEGVKGSVISILTTWIWNGGPFTVPSAMSKAGVNIMTKSLAAEWGKYGIRLNAIAPGPFPTKGAWERLSPGQGTEDSATSSGNPMGRNGEMQELRNLATFLMADGCDYLTGQTIAIDGAIHLASGGNFYQTLDRLSDDDWDGIRDMIRSSNDADKAKRSV